MAATISYCQDRNDFTTIYAWLFCMIGMISLFSATYLRDIGPVSFIMSVGLFFFRSQWMLMNVFVLAVVALLLEGVYSWFLARRVDPDNSRGWFWKTFDLGFFSLRCILQRARTCIHVI